MKISEHQEQNINRSAIIAAVILFAAIWIGCSSSRPTEENSYTAEEPQSDSAAAETPLEQPAVIQESKPAPRKTGSQKSSSSSQRFSVQADTVDVQRKKKAEKPATSISVKASTPKKFYTIEVGAFRLRSNVQRHQMQLSKRFALPVRILFDSSITLTRVCVGTFSSKSIATDFMKKMQQQYPQDYPDLWVSYWTK